eukprot:1855345-Rhodomonas_salina.2
MLLPGARAGSNIVVVDGSVPDQDLVQTCQYVFEVRSCAPYGTSSTVMAISLRALSELVLPKCLLLLWCATRHCIGPQALRPFRTVLCAADTRSGIDSDYAATRSQYKPRTTSNSSSGSIPLSCYAVAMQCPVLTYAVPPTSTVSEWRKKEAMSGSDVAYDTIALRICDAMSGSDLAHRTVKLGMCYAMSGSDLVYAATRMSCSGA